MSETTHPTESRVRSLLELEYAIALRHYLDGQGEAALRFGYEVGRLALARGSSLLDVAQLHHLALQRALPADLPAEEKSRKLEAAGQFLAECLSSFEMVYRGFKEANAALRGINELLEQEARRMARLLHDDAGQLLFAAHLAVADLERDLDPALRERLQVVTDLITRAEEQLRCLSHELYPPLLDDLGLVPTLELLAERLSKKMQVQVSVETSLEERLPPLVETVLYRVVREALANVAKHAQASRVWVGLDRDGDTVVCTVRDDGSGFHAARVLDGTGPRGLGLLGIRERLDAVGGTMKIQSAPGKGTLLEIKIPCEV